MDKKYFLIIAILTVSLVLMNCASIIHGTQQDVIISSSPQAADVSITNDGGATVFTGKTPTTATLQRKSAYTVKINLDGYQESMVQINKEFDPTYLGNLICGGVLGLIIDAANGAMYKLEPGEINVSLVTASIGENTKEIYAVLKAVDFDGELRTIVIPLIQS
ncbi:PEGA domain-containing protein [bacterium]|nr:PEGA domain-containing protein [bacterium]